MKIAVYSGSFNPIHRGHLHLAQYMLDSGQADEVWMVVSPCNPLKEQDDLIDHFLRLDMVIAAIQHKQHIKASDVEFDMPIPSYSIDTLNKLSQTFPEHTFCLLIGSDNALVFDQWKNYQEILDKYPVLVYPRRGYESKEVAKRFPKMQWLDSPYFDISSTEIRQLIAENQAFDAWVVPEVIDFIQENELYLKKD